eukprot:EG_transcript_24500
MVCPHPATFFLVEQTLTPGGDFYVEEVVCLECCEPLRSTVVPGIHSAWTPECGGDPFYLTADGQAVANGGPRPHHNRQRRERQRQEQFDPVARIFTEEDPLPVSSDHAPPSAPHCEPPGLSDSLTAFIAHKCPAQPPQPTPLFDRRQQNICEMHFSGK